MLDIALFKLLRKLLKNSRARETFFIIVFCLFVCLLLLCIICQSVVVSKGGLPLTFAHVLVCLINMNVVLNLLCYLILFQNAGSQFRFKY